MVQKCTNTIETGRGMQIHQAHLNGFWINLWCRNLLVSKKYTKASHFFNYALYHCNGMKRFLHITFFIQFILTKDGTGYLHPLKDISWATWPLVEEWLDSMLVSTLNKYQNCIVPQIMKINMLLLLQGFSKVLFIKVLSFTRVHVCIEISLKF